MKSIVPTFALLFSIGIFLSPSSSAQQKKIDSLQSRLKGAIHDTSRIKILAHLSELYRGKDNRKALSFADEALSQAMKQTSTRCLAIAHSTGGLIRRELQNYEVAQQHYEKAVRLAEELNLGSTLHHSLRGLALV